MKMNFEKKNKMNFKETLKKEAAQKIQFAIEHAISFKDLDSLNNKFFSEISNLETFRKKTKEAQLELKDSIAFFDSLEELRQAGKLLNWDKVTNLNTLKGKGFKNYLHYVLEHENAHLNVAEKEGQIVHGYGILFVKKDNLEIIPQILAFYEPLEDISDEEFYQVEKKILEAPDEYGNFMSGGDKIRLDLLNSLRNK